MPSTSFLDRPFKPDHVKILVRDEYRTALHELETNRTYRRGAHITGQPGIGTSSFWQKRTVAWEFTCAAGNVEIQELSTPLTVARDHWMCTGPCRLSLTPTI